MRRIVALVALSVAVTLAALVALAPQAAEPKQPEQPARLKVTEGEPCGGGALYIVKDQETGQEYMVCQMFNARGNAIAVTPMVSKKP